jgi:hypothetical protein
MERITVKIPSEMKTELKHICVDENSTLKELVTYFFKESLKNYQNQKK